MDEQKPKLLQAYIRYLVSLLQAAGGTVPPPPLLDGQPIISLATEDAE